MRRKPSVRRNECFTKGSRRKKKKAEMVTTRAATIAAKPAHEKEVADAARLAGWAANWAANPQEDKDLKRSNFLKMMVNKSEAEFKAIAEKRGVTNAARSPRSKAASNEKRSLTKQENQRRKEKKTMSWRNI
jgi:hypothetical protein